MPCHLSKIQRLRWQGGSLERGCLAHSEISWLSSLAQGASPHSHFHAPQCQHNLYAETYEYEKNSFFHSFSTSTSRFMKKGRLARAGDLWPERFIFMIHNLQKLIICSAGGLRGFSLNFLTLKHLLLFLGITQQSTNC